MTHLTMTEHEAQELMRNPTVLFMLADYHDFQQDHADSVGMGTMGDALRAQKLRDSACTIIDEDPDLYPENLQDYDQHKKRIQKAQGSGT